MVRKNIFLLLLLFIGFGLEIKSQKIPSEKPKLIVGIVIDQMRYDFLFRFWEKYDNNGFKRIINEGAFCKNARYNYLFTQSSSGYASIATGANPSVHGIVSDSWYNQLSDKTIHCTRDDKVQTIGIKESTDTHSPANLMASTFGDELKLASFKRSKVVSVSTDPTAAVILGGHMADGAYWFDITTGNWVTSSSYTNSLKDWVNDFNKKQFADTYLTQQWTTLLPDSLYTESLPDNSIYEIGLRGKKEFPYDINTMSLRANAKRDYSILRYTPYANNLTKDFAISAIVNESMGKDEYTDYICVNFAATGYLGQVFGIASREMEDAYLRLDKDIQHFLNFLDSYVGKGNVVVYLTSNHGAAYQTKLLTDMGFPTGNFNQGSAIALLKSYLNISYGNGNWITYYNNQQLFLNHSLIQDSKLNLEDFQNDVARFLSQFTGVTNVATSTQLTANNYTNGIFQKMQNSFHQKRSGDILISLEPGWTEFSDMATVYNSAYEYDTHVPLVFYGWKINRQTIFDPIDIIDIAPSLSMFLNIAYPNASQGSPIIQLIKQ